MQKNHRLWFENTVKRRNDREKKEEELKTFFSRSCCVIHMIICIASYSSQEQPTESC